MSWRYVIKFISTEYKIESLDTHQALSPDSSLNLTLRGLMFLCPCLPHTLQLYQNYLQVPGHTLLLNPSA